MNFTDLFVVAAVAAGLYAVIVALTRRRHFLVHAVNPYRGVWLMAALTSLWVGVGLLRWEAGSWAPAALLNLLSRLVTDEALSARGKVAAVAVLLGLLFVGLVIWCVVTLPRDPSAFRRPGDRKQAIQYYVGLKGGLDYAALLREDGERAEEAWDANDIRARIDLLPRIGGDSPDAKAQRRARTAHDQLQFWRQAAAHLHRSMPALDAGIAPAHQGRNCRLVFDTEYGGLFFVYLRPPNAEGDCLYLFGATLNQGEMTHKTADLHFDLLVKALRNIEESIRRS